MPCFVEVSEPDRAFGWSTVDAANHGSRWRHDLVTDGPRPTWPQTRLRRSMSIGPGPSGLSPAIDSTPDKEHRILQRRLQAYHANLVGAA